MIIKIPSKNGPSILTWKKIKLSSLIASGILSANSSIQENIHSPKLNSKKEYPKIILVCFYRLVIKNKTTFFLKSTLIH